MHEDDIPTLMTVDDAAEYLGVGRDRADELSRGWPVVGTYTPPLGARVPLFASDDVVTRCASGEHVLPPRRSRCKACRYERQKNLG